MSNIMNLCGVKIGDKIKSVEYGWMDVINIGLTNLHAQVNNSNKVFTYDFFGHSDNIDDKYNEIIDWVQFKSEDEINKLIGKRWEPEHTNNNIVIDNDGYAKNLECNSEHKDRIRKIGNLYNTKEEAEEAERIHRNRRLVWKYVKEMHQNGTQIGRILTNLSFISLLIMI